jgi:hypothetical protein
VELDHVAPVPGDIPGAELPCLDLRTPASWPRLRDARICLSVDGGIRGRQFSVFRHRTVAARLLFGIVFPPARGIGPAFFFLLALIGYLYKGGWRRDSVDHWLVITLIVSLIGQAVFMSVSGKLFDFEFDAAHTLKKYPTFAR